MAVLFTLTQQKVPYNSALTSAIIRFGGLAALV